MQAEAGLWDTSTGLPGGYKTEYISEFGKDRYGNQVQGIPPTPPRRDPAAESSGLEGVDTSDMWPTINSDYGVYANVPRTQKNGKLTYESPWTNGMRLPPPVGSDYIKTYSNHDYVPQIKGINSHQYPGTRDILETQFPRFYKFLPKNTAAYRPSWVVSAQDTRGETDVLKVPPQAPSAGSSVTSSRITSAAAATQDAQ